ncbi:MAG: glycosyl hydrolase family 32 [Phycisphaeraceae bacterium JB051]
MSETLYNGITLPDVWPPVGFDNRGTTPQVVPYLDNHPDVIDVSVGRQLFVDDFLIERDWSAMTRVYHKPDKYTNNPVLTPQSAEETCPDFPSCAIAKSGGVWFDDLDNKFKMWYMTGYLGYAALAVSDDGVHWDRPTFDVVPGTNLILPKDMHPDSGSVIIDHFAKDPSERYKMLLREPNPPGSACFPGLLLTSPDGIHWKQVGKTGDMDDRSTMFYNPFRHQWVQSVRLFNQPNGRIRAYNEHPDFVQSGVWDKSQLNAWLRADNLDVGKFMRAELYNFDAFAYESVMIGFHQILHGPPNGVGEKTGLPKLTELYLSTSRDGYHYHRPDRTPFIGGRREYGSWEYGYVESSAGMCHIVGDELWFYYSALAGNPDRITEDWRTNGTYANGSVGLAKLRRDGFASMRAMYDGGTVRTRKLKFTGKQLFVNANTVGSLLTVAVLDNQDKPITGLSHEDCVGFMGNSTCTPIRWKTHDLAGLGDQKVRLEFKFRRGDLYAFWITDDAHGKSGGFIAAGGPGLKGARDI